MKRVGFVLFFITISVMLSAQSGEEMLKRAISTNPTNNWDTAKQKGQWTTGSNMSAILHSSGDMDLGNFFGNKRHGYGISIVAGGRQISNCPNAKYYVGNWSNNEKSGNGTCYNASGTLIYDGEFKNDKPTSTYPTTGNYSSYKFQTIDYTSGDKYIGETKDGKRHGYGVYAWKDGRIWIGYWKDGVRSGQGIDIASNGSLLTGTWNNDTHTSPSTVASNSSGSSSSGSSSISSSSGSSSQKPPIVVVNNTSTNIRSISWKYSETFGSVTVNHTDTRVFSPYLGTGNKTTVELPKPIREVNQYDIEVEYTNGEKSTVRDILVKADSTLTISDGSRQSSSSSSSSGSSSSGSSSSGSSGGYSLSTMRCIPCYGTGRNSCVICSGTGRIMVGYQYVLCFMCSGMGSKFCTICNGAGQVTLSPPPTLPVVPVTPITPSYSSGSGGYSGSSGSSGSSSRSTTPTKHAFCNGTGLRYGGDPPRYNGVGDLVSKWCDICQADKFVGHYHVKCDGCNGTGYN